MFIKIYYFFCLKNRERLFEPDTKYAETLPVYTRVELNEDVMKIHSFDKKEMMSKTDLDHCVEVIQIIN